MPGTTGRAGLRRDPVPGQGPSENAAPRVGPCPSSDTVDLPAFSDGDEPAPFRSRGGGRAPTYYDRSFEAGTARTGIGDNGASGHTLAMGHPDMHRIQWRATAATRDCSCSNASAGASNPRRRAGWLGSLDSSAGRGYACRLADLAWFVLPVHIA